MKTIFRNLTLGVLMAGVSAVTATNAFAQNVCEEFDAKQALYKQFTDNLTKRDLPSRKIAVTAGKQYVAKYGACEDDKAIIDYLNTNLPAMETGIKTEEDATRKASETAALYTGFNEATKAKNVADIYAKGKQILVVDPKLLDLNIILASAGFDQAVANPPVDTYNTETINYAKNVIRLIEANTASTTGDYGAMSYSFKNDRFKDGKSNTLGAMNYFIGYIMYFREGKDNPAKRKEALPYFYKSLQFNSFSKSDPSVYQTIGAWYLDEAIKMDTARRAKITAAGDKDTDETLEMLANQKGYADRAIDAYARAYKLAKDNNAKKDYTDNLYARLTELYKFRYDGNIAGIDAFVATVQSKPMPDPSTAVTPVKEEVAPTTTSTTTTTPTNPVTPATNTTTPTKPVSTTTTKTQVNTTSAATTKTTVKKPAPKKKGTR
jgi:hypothetical protein